MNGLVRLINVRMSGRNLRLVDGNEWNVNQLLFVDDTKLVVDSEKRLKTTG